ncbi:MAG: hypothetical protein OEY52_10600 [Gammaproteobacteria bacterium]|nr:hypothetical protein [Gammaproteobacteria bacterium]
MTASLSFLSILVGTAVFIIAVSPVILIILLIKDWKGNQLW